MRERLTGPGGSRVIPADQLGRVPIPISGAEKAESLDCRRSIAGRPAPSLAGCQNQGASDDGERRGGFYGGMSGGLSRP